MPLQVYCARECRVLWSTNNSKNSTLMICEDIPLVEYESTILNSSNLSNITKNATFTKKKALEVNTTVNITANTTNFSTFKENTTYSLNNSQVPATPSPMLRIPSTPSPMLRIPSTPSPMLRIPRTPSPMLRIPRTPSPMPRTIGTPGTPSPNIRRVVPYEPSSSTSLIQNATDGNSEDKDPQNIVGIVIIFSVSGVMFILLSLVIITKVIRKKKGIHPCPNTKLRKVERPKDYMVEQLNVLNT